MGPLVAPPLTALDHGLPCAHRALDALLHQCHAPGHDLRMFESCYDVVPGEQM